MTFHFRHARSEDLPAIVAIYNASIPSGRATADTQPVSVESRRAWFEAHQETSRPLVVATVDGVMVGWTSLQDFYGRPAYRRTAEVSTYVAPEHHGKGVGSALRAHILALCPSLDVSCVVSFVFATNTASVRLNRKFGFSVWGELPAVAQVQGESVDLWIMGRHLDKP